MEQTSNDTISQAEGRRTRLLTGLICLMFLLFAMTTDSVGVVIPHIIEAFGLGLTAGGAFHYATMSGIAVAGLGLGFLADRLGRGVTIVLGLGVFAAASFLIAITPIYAALLALLFVSGAAIALFRTGALAVIGDLARSPREHVASMNTVEGFFAVGAVLGPLAVGGLLASGASWRWLYGGSGVLCVALAAALLAARFPRQAAPSEPPRFGAALDLARDPFALGFGGALLLYVGVEAAIYVWLPTLLAASGGLTPALALSVFFGLRALGRFAGAWLLVRADWTKVIAIATIVVLACFAGALAGGVKAAAILLPLSGLPMSVIYPTLNARAIGCFATSRQGAAAGLMLFFTCVGAVASPLAMGLLSDALGGPAAGFVLPTVLSALLAAWAVGAMILERRRGLFARRALRA